MKIVKKFPEKAEFLAENNVMKICHTLRCVYVLWKESNVILRYSVKDYFRFTTDFISILFVLLAKGLDSDNVFEYIV